MRIRTSTPERIDRPWRRRGRIAWLLALVLVIIILLGVLVINSFFVTEIRVQQENATDAAALAAAEVLADDALLFGDPNTFSLSPYHARPRESYERGRPEGERENAQWRAQFAPQQSLLCRAANAAIEFGGRNFVGGKSFEIRPADIFFDIVDIPNRSIIGTLPAEENSPLDFGTPLTLARKRQINSVHVVSRSEDARENSLQLPFRAFFSREMITRSTAVLDGYVRGFHVDPDGSINIPMAPVALNADSWSTQVEKKVDTSLATPANGPLPFGSFKLTIGARSQDPDARNPGVYSPILLIGTSSMAEAITQLNPTNPGITPTQYRHYLNASRAEMLALDPQTLQLPLSASPLVNSADLLQLQANLNRLVGKRLIWPLYSGYDARKQTGTVVVTGFVAARVADMKSVTYSIMLDGKGNAVPNSKAEGRCDQNPHHGKHERGANDDDRSDDNTSDNRKSSDDGEKSRGEHSRHRRQESCLEYSVLQVTLQPTMLATTTGVVYVRDWPTGPQHQFRFPNAYVKHIRLMK
ncbi:MAG TPA: hypothetical protein VFE62_25700 [Gemmataceae bacterium]|nr:hypothetical protein [Gemmataceae bacterium]